MYAQVQDTFHEFIKYIKSPDTSTANLRDPFISHHAFSSPANLKLEGDFVTK